MCEFRKQNITSYIKIGNLTKLRTDTPLTFALRPLPLSSPILLFFSDRPIFFSFYYPFSSAYLCSTFSFLHSPPCSNRQPVRWRKSRKTEKSWIIDTPHQKPWTSDLFVLSKRGDAGWSRSWWAWNSNSKLKEILECW